MATETRDSSFDWFCPMSKPLMLPRTTASRLLRPAPLPPLDRS
jgi:hypothetical protein